MIGDSEQQRLVRIKYGKGPLDVSCHADCHDLFPTVAAIFDVPPARSRLVFRGRSYQQGDETSILNILRKFKTKYNRQDNEDDDDYGEDDDSGTDGERERRGHSSDNMNHAEETSSPEVRKRTLESKLKKRKKKKNGKKKKKQGKNTAPVFILLSTTSSAQLDAHHSYLRRLFNAGYFSPGGVWLRDVLSRMYQWILALWAFICLFFVSLFRPRQTAATASQDVDASDGRRAGAPRHQQRREEE